VAVRARLAGELGHRDALLTARERVALVARQAGVGPAAALPRPQLDALRAACPPPIRS